jgi:hypothetical protein
MLEAKEGLDVSGLGRDMITASICDKYSVGPSIRPIFTRCCFWMPNIIQVCDDFD